MTRLASLIALAAALGACKPGPATTTETSGSESSTTDLTASSTGPTTSSTGPTSTTDASTTGGPPADKPFIVLESREVDILFVLDNSSSMATVQSALVQAADALLAPLTDPQTGLDIHIGFTTTDSGNPRCPAATYSPENGRLVLASCVDRVAQGEFVFNMEDFSSACTDLCALTDQELAIKPTATQYSDQAVPRAWIELAPGRTNLPDGVTPTQAFQCFAPQGVAGCGFESHLESLYRALAASEDAGSATNYGFLREGAALAVMLVSDETDCSYSELGKDIFTTNKVFWNDPNDPAPTSALCWRAGVACEGAGPTYTNCHASNHGLDGSADVPDDEAVLQPLSRYLTFLEELENLKKTVDVNRELLLALVTGVPPGYEDGLAELVYEDSPDPSFNDNFGIGPGCAVPMPPPWAVPPVREREVAEALQVGDERLISSICAPDQSPALGRLAQRILEQTRPSCIPLCIADTDPSTPILEPLCEAVEFDAKTQSETPVVPCDLVGDAFAVPAGQSVCFAVRVDDDASTPGAFDDLDPACAAEGFNGEAVILRSAPRPAGVVVSMTCALSQNKQKDCPSL